MRFDVLTLFPGMFDSPLADSILAKAIEKKLIDVRAHNLRHWAAGRHQVTDDSPYGGGAGMVMKVEPMVAAIRDLREQNRNAQVVIMTPQGRRFDQAAARELAKDGRGLVLVCGRYEGIDERVHQHVDAEFSIGDYVLTGGELPAMVIIDAVARLVPGVLGDETSAAHDTFEDGLLEYPQYTRPAEFEGLKVPEVLLSGDHGAIARWRRREQLRRTLQRRSDLLDRIELTPADREMLQELIGAE
ncbi:MAG: tRNA (guanosine(37)-N1)-methyltransferase TrmD [Desulfuromonas sp.]|nr:MAG: tRNA (guanosine(37)-N1)-methyltransferase TrmD [Desulfuromonas sp.]